MWLYFRLLLLALRLVRRSRRDLVLENLVLRQQLLVRERPDRRPRLTVACGPRSPGAGAPGGRTS